MFWFLVDVAICNAFIVEGLSSHLPSSRSRRNHLQFKLEVAKQLIGWLGLYQLNCCTVPTQYTKHSYITIYISKTTHFDCHHLGQQKAADSLIQWTKLPANQAACFTFSRQLMQSLRQCLPLANSQTGREKMWGNFLQSLSVPVIHLKKS